MRALAAGLVLAAVWLLAVPATARPGPTVLLAQVNGPITPVTARHLVDGVHTAERDRHAAFLVELDTPGGLMESMREIAGSFLNARVPVVVHVTPAGARAASAGAIITFAAHVAAMTPGTTIGAATPVDLEGGETSDKVINDAAAFAEAVAAQRGRNTKFATDTVRTGRAVTAAEAERLGAVDLLATDRTGLLTAIDGRHVTTAAGAPVVLRTAGAEVVSHELPLGHRLLRWLADPNLAFLFLSIGTLAVIYELASPGLGLGGITGIILLILGFASMAVLPVNLAGLLLLALAAGLFVAELFAPGIGVAAAGGTIALILAGLFLVEGTVGVSVWVLGPVALVVGGGTVLAGRLAWRARRAPSITGGSVLIGRHAVIRSVDDGSGSVQVDGTWWRVRRPGGPLIAGQDIRVTGVDGLDLLVEPSPPTNGARKAPPDPPAGKEAAS